MTSAAKVVDLHCGQLARVPNGGVVLAGAMTGFALNSGFRGLDAETFGKPKFAGRVALEAAKDSGIGVEGAVALARVSTVSRCDLHRFGRGEVRQAVLDVKFVVQPADKRDGLIARAEVPVGRFTGRQGTSMTGLGVLGELLRMAFGTGPAACVLARGKPGQQQNKQETASYQMNLPLN
jgi:hypothetical protein